MVLKNLAGNLPAGRLANKEEMQPRRHSNAQVISVQQFKVEGGKVQPCLAGLPAEGGQAGSFLQAKIARQILASFTKP